jgi:two-component system, chemotaxis family, chemotaxis protein CheY
MSGRNAALPLAWEEPVGGLARAPSANGRSVLVVEDDLDVREALVDALTIEGHVVATAGDGLEALQVARRRPPDLILLDLMMPRMSGWEFRAAQRMDPVLSSLPVIVMSACSREWDAELRAAAYLTKPFDLDTLLGLVERTAGPGPAEASAGSASRAQASSLGLASVTSVLREVAPSARRGEAERRAGGDEPGRVDPEPNEEEPARDRHAAVTASTTAVKVRAAEPRKERRARRDEDERRQEDPDRRGELDGTAEHEPDEGSAQTATERAR